MDSEEEDVEMLGPEVTVRSFLESKLYEGEAEVVNRAVDCLTTAGYLYMDRLKEVTYDEVISWKVPAFAAKRLQSYLKPAKRLQHYVKPSARSVTREQLETVCSGYWSLIKERLTSMTKKEGDFLSRYRRSRIDLCTISGRVHLLLQGLEEEQFYDASQSVLDMLKETNLVFLVNASGSGKTRTLFEVACRSECIFLSGVSETGGTNDGSRDLTQVAKILDNLYPKRTIPDDALNLCLRVLLISRFYLWKQASKDLPVLTNLQLTWLFKQVYFGYLNYPGTDPWLQLSTSLFDLFQTSSQLQASRDTLTSMLYDLQKETRWNGVVVIDECQELAKLLTNRFHSETANEVNRSMLDMLLLSFSQVGCQKLLVSGTGRHLLRMINTLSESVKNRLSYNKFTEFGEFATEESIKQFTLKYVAVVDDFDFRKIFQGYRGRYRFFVTALEMFLKESNSNNIPATNFLMKTWERLSREPGINLSINRSVWDDVVRFFSVPTFHPECLNIVITVLMLQVFSGRPAKIIVEDNDLHLVQAGIGRLTTKHDKALHFTPRADMLPTSSKTLEDVWIRIVEIGEPIVLQALWNFLTSTGVIQKRLINDLGACSEFELGVKFEPYSTPLLQTILERPAVKFLPKMYKKLVDEVYTRPLMIPNVDKCGLVCSMPPKDDGQFFLTWLTKFEEWVYGKQSDSFHPFIHTGELTWFGPDMIAGCIGEVQGNKVPVLALFQHKVTTSITLSEVLVTLDVDDFFLHRKSPRTHSDIEAKCVQKVKELVSKGGLLKWIICFTTDISSLRINRVHASNFGSVPTLLKNKGLVGILDKNMQVMLKESAWFIDAVEHLKASFR